MHQLIINKLIEWVKDLRAPGMEVHREKYTMIILRQYLFIKEDQLRSERKCLR